MMLKTEDILFIDNYLKHSKVMYADIRSEMTDHIATAVEREMAENGWEFGVVFKDYMAKNKRELMKMNVRSSGPSLALLKNYASFLTRPWMICFAFLIFFLFTIVVPNDVEAFYDERDFLILPFIWLLIVLIPQITVYILTRKRFYYLEKSGFVIGVLYQISISLMWFSGEVTAVCIALCCYISIGHIFYTMHNFRQFYIKRLYTAIIK